jgi:hypothetical protein
VVYNGNRIANMSSVNIEVAATLRLTSMNEEAETEQETEMQLRVH